MQYTIHSMAKHLQLGAALSQEVMRVLRGMAIPAGLVQLCRKLEVFLAQRRTVCALGCQLGSKALGLGSLVCPLRPQLPALLPHAYELSMLLQISYASLQCSRRNS